MASDTPHVFIASSSKAIDIAKGIKANLEKDGSCTAEIWHNGFFELSNTLLQDLTKKAGKNYSFAVFIFNADDELRIDKKLFTAARDNVVFEFGLFIGAIGTSRCYVVVPEKKDPKRPLRVPSDVEELTRGSFREPASGETWESATLTVSNKIQELVKKQPNRRSITMGDPIPVNAVETALMLSDELEIFALNSPDEPSVKLYHLLEKVHYGAQSIADAVWGSGQVVVSFKLQNTSDPKLLDCHYLPNHHHHAVRGGGFHPKTIPINGSASGAVFASGIPAVAESVMSGRFCMLSNGKVEKKFKKDFHESISDRVKSLIAWPVKLRGEVVCVVKCDSTIEQFFKRDDSRACTVVRLIASTFQRSFELGARENRAIMKVMDDAEDRGSTSESRKSPKSR